MDKVLVEGGRAVGVRLADGTEHRADDVVSAADGHATIFGLLEGGYATPAIRRAYQTTADLPAAGAGLAGRGARPLGRAARAHVPAARPRPRSPARSASRSTVRHFGYDPTLAPAGKSVVEVLLETDYDLWARLARDRGQYDGEKERIAEAVVQALDQRFPGLAQDVEALDVATPMTWERITGNWRGAYEAWLPTRGNISDEPARRHPHDVARPGAVLHDRPVGVRRRPAGRRAGGARPRPDHLQAGQADRSSTSVATRPPAHCAPGFP